MGQRTVAELMQCPLPSRCFTEQRPRPLVGQPPPAVGASIELGRNDVGQTRGHKERPSAAAGQVAGQEPGRRRVPHDDLPVAALAADRRTFTAYIEIFDVQGEDLAGPRGRGVEHAPQGFLAQPDMRAGPQRIERGEGDRPCLIPRGAAPFQARGRVVLDPALALAVADKNPGRGESCVPGRRGPLSPASDEPVLEIDSRECRHRHLGPERLDQGTLGRPIGASPAPDHGRQRRPRRRPRGSFSRSGNEWRRPSGVPTRDNPQASFGSSRPNTLA